MLADELPSRNQEAVTFMQVKHKERAELETLTQEFLSKGNKVDKIPSGFNPPPMQISKELAEEKWHTKSNKIADVHARQNNSINKKPTPHQNIYEHSVGGYYVQIGNCFVGRKDTIAECQELRDIKRKEMRLPPAMFR